MASDITDLLSRVTDSTTARPVIAALAGSGKAIGASSITITDATGWTTASVVYFSIYKTQTVGGVTIKDPTTQTDWKATLSGTTLSNLTITGGTDRAYVAGDIVEQTPTARYAKDMYDNIRSHANQDGSLIPSAVKTALALGSDSLNGWNPLAYVPNTVTYNGNRSYNLVFSGQDLTGTLSNGMRLRTTRTVTAPTRSTSLNGTSQCFFKASPAGMTFTNNFTCMAWVKLSSYATGSIIARRPASSDGWNLEVNSSGVPAMYGLNGTSYRGVAAYQSIPLNKWVHIAATLNMSANTGSIYIDGVAVPTTMPSSGAPASLVQSSDFMIGGRGTSATAIELFPGKVAQAAVFSAVLTQATIQSYISQGLSGSETSLISAYSFNNSITDLNTTNANNLTANGGATATNADSPFTQDDTGTPGGTLDFGIVMKKSFSTNTTLTVQVPEGCTIPTTGGVTAVAYGTGVPYSFPASRNKWRVETLIRSSTAQGSPSVGTWYNIASYQILIPAGEWSVYHRTSLGASCASASTTNYPVVYSTLSTANNSESDPTTSAKINGNNALEIKGQHTLLDYPISLTTPTTYYLNEKTDTGTTSAITLSNDGMPSNIIAESAYL